MLNISNIVGNVMGHLQFRWQRGRRFEMLKYFEILRWRNIEEIREQFEMFEIRIGFRSPRLRLHSRIPLNVVLRMVLKLRLPLLNVPRLVPGPSVLVHRKVRVGAFICVSAFSILS